MKQIHITHSDWLREMGYVRFMGALETPYQVLFQKKIEINHLDGLVINVNAFNHPNMPGGIRYEVEAQLSNTITMNVTIFTLFDGDLIERLPGIEDYVLRLQQAFSQEVL